MGTVFGFLFLLFGWIWISSSLTADTIQKKKSNQAYEVEKTRKDNVIDRLKNRSLENKLREELFWGREKSEATTELYRRKIAEILGSEERIPNLYVGDKDSEAIILMLAMSDYGKVPYINLVCQTYSNIFYYRFCPHLSDKELIKLLRWYEGNLRRNGGYNATIMCFAGATCIGAFYFDGTIIPSPPEGKRLW